MYVQEEHGGHFVLLPGSLYFVDKVVHGVRGILPRPAAKMCVQEQVIFFTHIRHVFRDWADRSLPMVFMRAMGR